MRTPDLSRLVETFVLVGTEPSPDRHFRMLRTIVAPVLRDLRDGNLIGWFSFLVHDHNSGVPTTPNDTAAYLHLRFERMPGIDFDTLLAALPEFCVFSRPVSTVDERSLHPADHTALVAPEVATGWALFGQSAFDSHHQYPDAVKSSNYALQRAASAPPSSEVTELGLFRRLRPIGNH